MEKDILSLPPAIKVLVISDAVIDANNRLEDDFSLDDDQFSFLLNTILSVIIKRLPVLELPTKLSMLPRAEGINIRTLALRVAVDRLWPLQDYLGNVDKLIARLGGTVPVPISLLEQQEEPDIQRAQQPAYEFALASEIIRNHPDYRELYLTQKPLKDDDDRLKTPTVKNWLADYLHTMGAEGASSLKRSQYMAKSRNVALLNSEEKKNLLNFFVSYEEGVSMYWCVADGQYLVIAQEMPAVVRAGQASNAISAELPQLVAYLEDTEQSFEKLFNDHRQGIEVEIAGNKKKLNDIIWDALGFGEVDRCLAALDLVINRHAFFDMVKTDRRYSGIAAREIESTYGLEAKNMWDKDLTRQVSLAVFWRLILVDKLGIEEGRATVLAHYFSKKLGPRESPVYLDLKSGSFLFRPVVYKNKVLQFEDQQVAPLHFIR